MNVKKLFDLTGKIVIVTGGRGIYGASISEGLCEMGATVIIASRNGEKCEEFASTLRDKGYIAEGLSLDLGSDESVSNFVSSVIKKHGKIDVLINNAVDRSNLTPLSTATREKLQNSMSTNLNGQIILTKLVIEEMIKQNKGNVINISSMRGIDCPHFPFYPESMGDQAINYTTEKWAMIGMTKYLAGRYGKNNIRVNAIAPGGFNPSLKDNPNTKEFYYNYINNCPLGRLADDDDIKGPIVFLASDASSYVTGETLVMDGGWTIW
ncbi:MAG: SDR family oxidoreductase [Clostridia bacterium]|nr:SDR family oxidoreductase [Clostridia bacterium]